MIECGTRDNFFRENLLWEWGLTLPKAISACHAAEKTRKHALVIKRTIIIEKSVNFAIALIPTANVQFMEKLFCNKKKHFKFCCHILVKKVHDSEKDESDEPSDQSDYEFFIETINIQNPLHVTQIKNENTDWSIPEVNVNWYQRSM